MTSPLVRKASIVSKSVMDAWPVIVFVLVLVGILAKIAGIHVIQEEVYASMLVHESNEYPHGNIAEIITNQAVFKTKITNIENSLHELKSSQKSTSEKLDKILLNLNGRYQ